MSDIRKRGSRLIFIVQLFLDRLATFMHIQRHNISNIYLNIIRLTPNNEKTQQPFATCLDPQGRERSSSFSNRTS